MKQSRKKKRVWSESEQVIAYYLAKWGFSGLNVSSYDLVNFVIGNTTENSLFMQVANFRYLLNIEGWKLEHTSDLQVAVAHKLQNKTIVQVRRMVLDYIASQENSIKILAVKHHNKKVETKKKEANQQLQIDFDSKFLALSRSRNLVRI